MKIQYIRVGDYFIPDLELPQESRPMGKWHGICQGYFSDNKNLGVLALFFDDTYVVWNESRE